MPVTNRGDLILLIRIDHHKQASLDLDPFADMTTFGTSHRTQAPISIQRRVRLNRWGGLTLVRTPGSRPEAFLGREVRDNAKPIIKSRTGNSTEDCKS